MSIRKCLRDNKYKVIELLCNPLYEYSYMCEENKKKILNLRNEISYTFHKNDFYFCKHCKIMGFSTKLICEAHELTCSESN